MEIRFYLDPDTGLPHIYGHGVSETDVARILRRPIEEEQSARGTRQAIGQTEGGRYLRVIYVPDDDDDSVFVITSYPLNDREIKALRRRTRRRGR